MLIDEIRLYRIRLPLLTPYRLSYRTVEAFEPLLVEVVGGDGRSGWGEAHISAGSGAETPAGGWAFCRELAARLHGGTSADAKAGIWSATAASPIAATALVAGIEMLEGEPLLAPPTRLPLLTPVNGLTADDIATEIEARLVEGYRTFKVKVGKEVDIWGQYIVSCARSSFGLCVGDGAYGEAGGSGVSASRHPARRAPHGRVF